jgi:hypothetical protein
MSSPPTEEEIYVARLIVQSFQCDAAPGASVNHTNNPFIFGLIGSFDALKMAERIVVGIDRHRADIARGRAELEARATALKPAVAPAPGV